MCVCLYVCARVCCVLLALLLMLFLVGFFFLQTRVAASDLIVQLQGLVNYSSLCKVQGCVDDGAAPTPSSEPLARSFSLS